VEKDINLTISPRHFILHVGVSNPSGRRLPEVLPETIVTTCRISDDGGARFKYEELVGHIVIRPSHSELASDPFSMYSCPKTSLHGVENSSKGTDSRFNWNCSSTHLKPVINFEILQTFARMRVELRDFFLGLSAHAEAAEENVDWEMIRRLLRSGDLESGHISFAALKSVYQLAMEEIRQAELRSRK